MPTLVLRSTKGSPLTHSEMDDNFRYVDDVVDGIEANMQSAQDSATASANSATASAGSAATAELYANVLAHNFKPSINPSIDLDFNQQDYSVYEIPDGINKKPLTDIATVTRAGNASYFDATGVMRTAGTDVPRINYNPDTGVCEGLLVEESRTNLIEWPTNAEKPGTTGFSTGTASVNTNVAQSLSGAYNADYVYDTSTTSSQYWNKVLFIDGYLGDFTGSVVVQYKDSDSIRLNVRLYGTTVCDYTGYFRFSDLSHSAGITVSDEGNGYYRLSITVENTDASNIYGRVLLYPATAYGSLDVTRTGGVNVSHAQLEQGSFPTSYIPDATIFNSRASTATYYDSTGTLQTAAVNEARYSYNPANLRAEPKLLLEESRTNSCLYSEDASSWNENAPYVTFGGNDTTNGIQLTQVFNNDTGIVRRFQTTVITPISVISGNYICASLVIKKASASLVIRVRFADSIGFINDWTFNANTLEVGKAGDGSFNAQSLGGDYFRISVTNSCPRNDAGFYTEYQVYDTNAGQVFYVGGLQQEISAYPTSYIPTTTTAVTRAADISTGVQAIRAADNVVRTLGDEFNPSEGVIYGEFTCTEKETLVGLFSIGDGVTATDELSLRVQSGTVRVDCGVVGQVISTGLYPSGQKTKYCLRYTKSSIDLFVNSIKYSASDITLPATMNTLTLGTHDWSANRLSLVTVKDFEIYPKALSEQECIALTQ